MQLNVKAFAITSGLLWGLGLFLLTWWVIIWEGPTGATTPLGHIYLGYCISPLGSFVGLLWGLVDGVIGGALFAWIYNTIAGKPVEISQ